MGSYERMVTGSLLSSKARDRFTNYYSVAKNSEIGATRIFMQINSVSVQVEQTIVEKGLI